MCLSWMLSELKLTLATLSCNTCTMLLFFPMSMSNSSVVRMIFLFTWDRFLLHLYTVLSQHANVFSHQMLIPDPFAHQTARDFDFHSMEPASGRLQVRLKLTVNFIVN